VLFNLDRINLPGVTKVAVSPSKAPKRRGRPSKKAKSSSSSPIRDPHTGKRKYNPKGAGKKTTSSASKTIVEKLKGKKNVTVQKVAKARGAS
jgi:hypothetical protein